MLECVPNVSEGRDAAVLDALSAACGPSVLDRHTDPDHHRSVFTLAGPAAHDAEGAARRLTLAAADQLDLRAHAGVHPRLGIVDVVPFVALDGDRGSGVVAALAFARWIACDLRVPAFLYDDADTSSRSLPELRRDAFGVRAPDFGPAEPHPRLGATAVGAREHLVAVNCVLDRDDLTLARAVATRVRAGGGGLPGVRALGLPLASQGRSQVSMNLARLAETGLEAACDEVRRLVEAAGANVESVEVVGLVPAAELERTSTAFRAWSGIGASCTIEARLAAAPAARRGTLGL